MVLSFMPGIINLFWLPTGVETEWYTNLLKFPFTPGINWFGIIWSVVHILLGVGLFMVLKKEEETKNSTKAIGLFLTNIILSAAWPFILFKYNIIILSTIDAVALIILAILMQKSFAKENKYSGYIVYIYILWLMFSLYMNLGLLILN